MNVCAFQDRSVTGTWLGSTTERRWEHWWCLTWRGLPPLMPCSSGRMTWTQRLVFGRIQRTDIQPEGFLYYFSVIVSLSEVQKLLNTCTKLATTRFTIRYFWYNKGQNYSKVVAAGPKSCRAQQMAHGRARRRALPALGFPHEGPESLFAKHNYFHHIFCGHPMCSNCIKSLDTLYSFT